jgi:hypothetical protein
VIARNKVLTCLAFLLALPPALCHALPPAPAPTFTITASNITMPSNGIGSIAFTLTSVNGFTGQVAVDCTPPTVAADVRLPYINLGGPVHTYTLTANGTTSGSIGILALKPALVPVRLNLPARPASGQKVIWSLAGILLLGLGLHRRKAWPTRLSLAICLLITLTSLSACSSGPTLTPGTYTYTLNATQVNVDPPALTATTTLTVTVPPGIPTN